MIPVRLIRRTVPMTGGYTAHSAGDWPEHRLLPSFDDKQDLTAERDGLATLGLPADRIYVGRGLTGTNRERPGLHQALAACHAGDTLVVTKLDRLARFPDVRAIADELTQRSVKLNLGGSVHDPTDAVGQRSSTCSWWSPSSSPTSSGCAPAGA